MPHIDALDVKLDYNVNYQPGLDEPCVFTGNHRRRVSIYWLTWFIRNNPRVNFQEAQARGEALIKQLNEELPRKLDPKAEPIKLIDCDIGGSIKTAVRLEWVI